MPITAVCFPPVLQKCYSQSTLKIVFEGTETLLSYLLISYFHFRQLFRCDEKQPQNPWSLSMINVSHLKL